VKGGPHGIGCEELAVLLATMSITPVKGKQLIAAKEKERTANPD
jgi:hypothetical protein